MKEDKERYAKVIANMETDMKKIKDTWQDRLNDKKEDIRRQETLFEDKMKQMNDEVEERNAKIQHLIATAHVRDDDLHAAQNKVEKVKKEFDKVLSENTSVKNELSLLKINFESA